MEALMRGKWLLYQIGLIGLASAICLGGPALAAGTRSPAGANRPSFDCAKASGTVEAAICSSATLADLDRKMARQYQSVLSQLSPRARAEVRDSQRQWLKIVRMLCATARSDNNPIQEAIRNCTQEKYEDRYAHLSVRVVDGRTYYTLQGFLARTRQADDKPGHNPAFVTAEAAYDLIDRPSTALEKAINDDVLWVIKNHALRSVPKADYRMEIRLVSASTALISFKREDYFYWNGVGKNSINNFYYSHWLVREGRELSERDIFSGDTKWSDFLRSTYWEGIKEFGEHPSIRGDVSFASSWLIEKQGLTISGKGLSRELKVAIPWGSLKPYLAPGASEIIAGYKDYPRVRQ